MGWGVGEAWRGTVSNGDYVEWRKYEARSHSSQRAINTVGGDCVCKVAFPRIHISSISLMLRRYNRLYRMPYGTYARWSQPGHTVGSNWWYGPTIRCVSSRPARVFDVHDGVGSSDGGVCAGLRASVERFHEGFVTVNASARSQPP